MQYKLLAIDLDDTLLRHDLTISQRNIKAIQRAVDKGVKVTLASGRATLSVAHYLDVVGLDLPVVTYQGARVVDTRNGQVMYKKELACSQAMPIIELAEKMNIHCNIFVDDIIYVEKMTKWAEAYRSLSKTMPMKAIGKLSAFLDGPTTKIILIDEHERLKAIKPQAEALCGEEMNVFFSKPFYLEFTNKYGTKGAAVKFLGEHLGIKQEEIMAIGDTYNDISMIEYAGLGVCMSNGPDEVKQLADYVALSNEEDGVAHTIEKFIL
ncbi:MAG: Cof-type HAD-IIB family hydrolase [Firmicutes bacterium]|nr:Cof-type HAD-IIB family hydrolase [Bacillota bacterium]